MHQRTEATQGVVRILPISPSALHWLAAIGVLCLAFLLRFYGLADRPQGIWFDPA